ncbi:MAG TPA: hypothetical protein VGD26_02910 [Chitinophagaceae bacterium]
MYDYLNEVLLIVAMVMLILLPKYLLERVSKPAQSYIRIIAAVLFMALVWLGADKEQMGLKIFLTIVVLASVTKSLKENRKVVS